MFFVVQIFSLYLVVLYLTIVCGLLHHNDVIHQEFAKLARRRLPGHRQRNNLQS